MKTMKMRVLAVVLLGIITAVGAAEVHGAEAATTSDGTYYPDILEVQSGLSNFKEILGLALDTCEYFFVLKNSDTFYRIGFIDSDTAAIGDIGCIWTNTSGSLGFHVSHLFNVSCDENGNWICGSLFGLYSGRFDFVSFGSKGSEFRLLGTNFPLHENYLRATGGVELPQNNLSFPGAANTKPVYGYIYSSSGPVAAAWHSGINNLMYFIPAEAEDLEDFYVQSDWTPKYDKWNHTINYYLEGDLPALAGSDPTDGNMYKLYSESVIAFPSKKLVDGWISAGMSPVELYFDKGQSNWHQTVYEGGDTNIKFKVTSESVPEYYGTVNGAYAFQSKIPMGNIVAAIDAMCDGGLRSYYGLSEEMWDLWKNSVYSYVMPYEIYTVLYALEDADTYIYGNMHYSVVNMMDTDPGLLGYSFTGGVIDKPLEDITEDDKAEMQVNTTKAELAKRTEELKKLREEYVLSQKLNGDAGDIFGIFNNLLDGIRGSSSVFKGITTAVGNVFSFFPREITSVLYSGFVALIIIAVYKSLRG